MDPVTIGRVLMGDSFGFHVIFALLTMGLPVLITAGEFWALKTKNQQLRSAVRQWATVATIVAIASLLSILLICIQFSVMWPRFVEFMMPVMGHAVVAGIGLLVVQVIFLLLHAQTWEKVSSTWHVILALLSATAGIKSVFLLTSVNAWMNSPAGFELKKGVPTNIDPFEAILNPAVTLEAGHSMFAYMLATTLIIASAYAWLLFKKSGNSKFYHYLLTRLCGIAVIIALIVVTFGHFSAQYLAKYEPRKLAAMELHTETSSNAPLIIGGFLDETTGEVKYGIEIPYALSILAGWVPSTVVTGLNDFPRAEWPPLVIHLLFGIKMTLVTLLFLVPTAALIFYWLRRKTSHDLPRWLLPVIGLSGLAAITIVELGWMLVEIGRQPYVINGYLLNKDAFTLSMTAQRWGILFPLAYIVLFAITGWALYRRWYQK